MSVQSSGSVKERTRETVKFRPKYNCVYHNDDTTSFEFVVKSLQLIFNRTEEEGFLIAYDIHTKGRGIVNKKPLSKDIALTKQKEVQELSKTEGFSLKVTVEEI